MPVAGYRGRSGIDQQPARLARNLQDLRFTEARRTFPPEGNDDAAKLGPSIPGAATEFARSIIPDETQRVRFSRQGR